MHAAAFACATASLSASIATSTGITPCNAAVTLSSGATVKLARAAAAFDLSAADTADTSRRDRSEAVFEDVDSAIAATTRDADGDAAPPAATDAPVPPPTLAVGDPRPALSTVVAVGVPMSATDVDAARAITLFSSADNFVRANPFGTLISSKISSNPLSFPFVLSNEC